MFFERRCPGCGVHAVRICGACWSTLVRSAPVPFELAELGNRLRLDGLGALSTYQPHSRRILLAAKNGGRCDLLWVFGANLSRVGGSEVDVITWVPASRKMRRRRGYDQGRILARALSRQTGVPARTLLRRGSRQAQAGASRAERLRGPDLIGLGVCPASVVVVDDVCTTGASLAAAASALRANGAVEVSASVVSVVGGTKVPEWPMLVRR